MAWSQNRATLAAAEENVEKKRYGTHAKSYKRVQQRLAKTTKSEKRVVLSVEKEKPPKCQVCREGGTEVIHPSKYCAWFACMRCEQPESCYSSLFVTHPLHTGKNPHNKKIPYPKLCRFLSETTLTIFPARLVYEK